MLFRMLSLEWILLCIVDIVYRIIARVLRYTMPLLFHARKVPPVKDSILLMSATELAKLIREQRLTSESVIQTFIDRILEVEPFINATVDCRFKEALEEAKEVDALVASGAVSKEQLEKEKPLLGVPFSVKVLLTVKGLRSTAGSLLFKDVISEEDAPTVTLMKKAGAIVLATTNSSEVGCNLQSSNYIHGTTCNPYNTSRTSGGSSGGESALLASGGSVIGLGNDLAGSVRIPAMFTGIFSHKASKGLVSNEGMFPPVPDKLARYLYTGPMCRYAQDLVTTMKILSVPDEKNVKFGEKVDFKEITFYYITSYGDNIPVTEDVHVEIKDAVKKVASYFQEDKGSNVMKVTFPKLRQSFLLYLRLLLSSVPSIQKVITAGKAKLNGIHELLKCLCRRSKFTLLYVTALNGHNIPFLYRPNMLDSCERLQKDIDDELSNLLDDKSVLIMPTMPFPAPYHHEITPRMASTCYTCIFNLLGMPSTQCPVGFNKEGLPIGVQVISKRGNDYLTLACAMEIEKAFGGWKPPE